MRPRTWHGLPLLGTGLDHVSRRMIRSSDGHVLHGDDPKVMERVRKLLNARPVAYVVGPSDFLDRADRHLCDTSHEYVMVDTLEQAREEWLSGPRQGRAIYGQFFAPLSPDMFAEEEERPAAVTTGWDPA